MPTRWIGITVVVIGFGCAPPGELPALRVPSDAMVGGAKIEVALEVPIEDLDRDPGGDLVLPPLRVAPR